VLSLSSAELIEASMSASAAMVKPALSNLRMNRPILVRSASSDNPTIPDRHTRCGWGLWPCRRFASSARQVHGL